MRSRIVLLLAFGLTTVFLLGAAFLAERGELRRSAMDRLADAPASLGLLGGDDRDGQRLHFGLDAVGSTALERVLEGLARAPAA